LANGNPLTFASSDLLTSLTSNLSHPSGQFSAESMHSDSNLMVLVLDHEELITLSSVNYREAVG
jgi:hypothetical protein